MRNYVAHGRQRERNVSHKVYGPKLYMRSRIANGFGLLPCIDGRSAYGHRVRDHIAAFVSDLGGIAACSAGERALVQRVASLCVELEHFEGRLSQANGTATSELLLTYCATAKTLNRVLQTLGLRRRPKDISLDLAQYLAQPAQQAPMDGVLPSHSEPDASPSP
jgi:hypothetical protein